MKRGLVALVIAFAIAVVVGQVCWLAALALWLGMLLAFLMPLWL